MMLRSLLFVALSIPGLGCATEAQHVKASGAWIRLLPANLPAGGFVTLQNDSDQAATLRSANSAAYGSVMLHKSSTEGGMGRMEMVDSLAVPAHGKAELSPGGYHLMLMNAPKPLAVGDKVVVHLMFADGSMSDVEFVVRPANAVSGE
jgi:periplasmic copper chaperone A